MFYHEIVSSSSSSDSPPLEVAASDHVNEVDVGVLLAMGDVTKRPLSAVVLILKMKIIDFILIVCSGDSNTSIVGIRNPY